MEKIETYSTLHEIRLRKELIRSEIKRDNQQMSQGRKKVSQWLH